MEKSSGLEKGARGRKRPPPLAESAPAASGNETDSRAGVASDSSDPNRASSSSADASNPQGTRSGGGTYPEPSTFVERVMHVLENDLAPDAIWWVDDGNGVAIHPEEMKTSGLLAKFFSRNRFATFVRTLTRWGFKRVPDYNLPDQVIGLRNGLFQKARPQLVQYMMMDSDVQDVFEEHQKNIAQQTRIVSTATPAQYHPGEHSLTRQAGTIVHEITSLPTPVAAQASILSTDALEDQSLVALRMTLQHAQNFLNMVSANTEATTTLRGIMNLLLVEGQKHLQHEQTRQQQQPFPAATTAVPQQLPQESVHPPMNQPTAQPQALQEALPGLNLVQQLMHLQLLLQQQQQQAQPQPQVPQQAPMLQPQLQVPGIHIVQQQEGQQPQNAGGFTIAPPWQLLQGFAQIQQQPNQQNQPPPQQEEEEQQQQQQQQNHPNEEQQ